MIFNRFPQALQLSEAEERALSGTLFKQVESALIHQNNDMLGILTQCLNLYHTIHKFTLEEKHRLVTLLLTHLCRPDQQHLFIRNDLLSKILQYKHFIKQINKKIHVDWIQVEKLLHDLKSNKQVSYNLQDQNIQKFLTLLGRLTPPREFLKILQNNMSQGNEQLVKLLNISRTEPTETYRFGFELILELYLNENTHSQFYYPLLVGLIKQKPDLPVDDYMEDMIRDLNQWFMNSVITQKHPQKVRNLTSMIIALIVPISVRPKREKLWTLLERFISSVRDTLHPNNNHNNSPILEFLYQLVKQFVVRVLTERHHDKKEDATENEQEQVQESLGVNETPNEKQEDEENEQEDSDEDSSDEIDYKDFHIDQDAIQRFTNIIKPLLKYLIYFKDNQRAPIGSIFGYMVHLDKIHVNDILQYVSVALARGDIKPHTIITILERVLPALSEEHYPQLANIMRHTNTYINDYCELIWRFYDRIFQFIPLTEEIADLSMEAFRTYMSVVEYLDNQNLKILIVYNVIASTRNKFIPFVFACNQNNLKEVVDVFINFFDESLLKLNEQIRHLMAALLYRDASYVIEFFNVLYNKVVKRNEFYISNPATIINYLVLIVDLLSLGRHHVQQIYTQIRSLVGLCLASEEYKIQQHGVHILTALVLSQTSIHLDDFYQTKAEFKFIEITNTDFLQQIFDDYLYPAISQLSDTTHDVASYVKNNFTLIIESLNEPLCSTLMTQDLKIRRKISLNLQLVSEFLLTIEPRARKGLNDKFQFKMAQDLRPRIHKLVCDFYVRYIEQGLSGDQRIAEGYFSLCKALLGAGDQQQKLISLRKWLRIKILQSRHKNRYQYAMLATYLLNQRISEISYYEDSQEYLESLQYIFITLMFQQNETLTRKYQHFYSWYFKYFIEDWMKEFAIFSYKELINILKGNLFSQQHLPLYQKNFISGLSKFALATFKFNSQLQSTLYADIEAVYNNLADKTFRGQFNQILLDTQFYIKEIILQGELKPQGEQKIIIIDDEELRKQTTLERIKPKEYTIDEEQMINLFRQSKDRDLVVHGVPLMLLSTCRIDMLTYAAQLNISSEFKIRSFGRTLLLKFRQLVKAKHTKYEFVIETNNEYTVDRYRQGERQTDSNNMGMFQPYHTFTKKIRDYKAIEQELIPFKELFTREFSQEFLKIIFLDITVMESAPPDMKDFTNIYNDISSYISQKLVKFKTVKGHFLQHLIVYRLFKFILHATDLNFYKDTIELIDWNAIDDKDVQAFQRIYFSSLIAVKHSGWQHESDVFSSVFKYFDMCIEIQSKELFILLHYNLYLVFNTTCVRRMKPFLNLLIQRIHEDQQNEFKLVRWLQLFYYSVEQKKLQYDDSIEQVCQLPLQEGEKVLQMQLILLSLLTKRLPHTVKVENSVSIRKHLFVVQSDLFKKQYASLQIQSNRKIIVDTISGLFQSMYNYIMNSQLLTALQEHIFYLLQCEPENELEAAKINTFLAMIAQQSTSLAQDMIVRTLQLAKSAQGKIKVTQLSFIQRLIQFNICEPHTTEIALLKDDNKFVYDSIQSLLIQEMITMNVEQLKKISQSTDLTLLTALIMTHPRFSYPWSNDVIKAILDKHDKQIQKRFAADFLKLYKDNILADEEDQIAIELIERMSELSNPIYIKMKVNVWNKLLFDSGSQKRFWNKNVIVFGQKGVGKRSLIDALSEHSKTIYPKGNYNGKLKVAQSTQLLDYTFLNVIDSKDPDIATDARINMYVIEDYDLIGNVLNNQSIRDTAIMICLDLAEPWTFMEDLDKYVQMIQNAIPECKLNKQEYDEITAAIKGYIMDFNETDPLAKGLSLREGVLQTNIGMPIIIAITKSDILEAEDKGKDWDKQAECIQYHLRSYAIHYGATVLVTSVKSKINVKVLYEYLLHRLYGAQLNFKSDLSLENLFIPVGVDDLDILKSTFQNQVSSRFQDVVTRQIQKVSIYQQQNTLKEELLVEDDQDFFSKLKEKNAPSLKIPIPTTTVPVATDEPPQPTSAREQNPQLKNFYDKILNKTTSTQQDPKESAQKELHERLRLKTETMPPKSNPLFNADDKAKIHSIIKTLQPQDNGQQDSARQKIQSIMNLKQQQQQ